MAKNILSLLQPNSLLPYSKRS